MDVNVNDVNVNDVNVNDVDMDVDTAAAMDTAAAADVAATSASPFCVIDVKQWPLCIVHLKRPAYNVAEMDEFGDVMATLLHEVRTGVRPGKFYIMIIVDGIVDSSMQIRLRAASIIARLRADARECLHAIAIVASNTLARSIVQLVLMIQPLQTCHNIFATSTAAAEWLDARRDELEGVEPGGEELV